jgi:uncharacterized protein
LALEFEWDPRKDAANLAKHGVSFEEAASVFGDPVGRIVSDPRHSEDEERLDRRETIRIISERQVTRSERKNYAEGLN